MASHTSFGGDPWCIWDCFLTYPSSEPLRDTPRGARAPTAKSLFIWLLKLPFCWFPNGYRGSDEMQGHAAFNLAGHCWTTACLVFLRNLCRWFSIALLWKHFSFHMLLTKCFVKCLKLNTYNWEQHSGGGVSSGSSLRWTKTEGWRARLILAPHFCPNIPCHWHLSIHPAK